MVESQSHASKECESILFFIRSFGLGNNNPIVVALPNCMSPFFHSSHMMVDD